ncbi:membrane protein involved in the export of O-antigen and teichoic acid [Rivularia sp. PCC 7116]|uniref:oligosaccharide flippase family protein n=1 Tax=Rivularia sp. PCC 7116 TaxID=373994 RepID=UPI00029EC9BD|nr:oligosaccharide flippase family protein [Rivularia sp. PCC 7116]AFY57174.1 membrane protein involved in the export of O-antigen and teichoic acid [Rivularia sp. PCC 7116]
MTQISTKKIAASGLWLTASFGFTKVSQLISQIFLARLLSPSDFGVWGMVLIVTTLASLFKDAAIATVLVQRGLEDQKLVNAVYSLGVNISIGMFVIQALAGYPLAVFFKEPLVFPLTLAVACIFIVSAGAGSHGAVLQREMKFRELAIADSCAGFARFAGAVVCAFLGGGIWSFAVAEIAMSAVDALLKRKFSRYRFQYYFKPDSQAIREVRTYISSLVGINLAVYVNTNADNLIIGRLIGAKSLGYYNLAYQLAMLPTFALSQINRMNLSVMSQRDNQARKIYLCQMLEIYAVFYAGIYGVGFVIAPWIIPLVYGEQWTSAVSIFEIVLIFAYARGFMSILGTALNAIDKPWINAAINWILVPLSIPAFFVGASLAGVAGVAIAVAIVMGIAASIWFWLAVSHAAKWNIIDLLKPVMLPTFTITVALITVIYLPLSTFLHNIFQPLLLIAIYIAGLSIFSWGRIPRLLIHVVRISLNSSSEKS